MAALLGCGDDGSPSGGEDGGVGEDGGAPGVAAPAAPAEAARPVVECPDGWTADEDESGASVCAPWPGDALPDCSGAEARLPGTSSCAPVGRPCPSGSFADDLPASGVLYVDPAASGSGDGSRASPFSSFAAAVDAASSGETIALAAGEIAERVSIDSDLTVRGACAAETRLRAPSPSDRTGTIEVTGGRVIIEDLSIRGDRPAVTVEPSDAEVTLRGIVVEDVISVGVLALGPVRLEAEQLVIRGTRETSDALGGRALAADGGSTVEIRGAVLDRNVAQGLFVAGAGTSARLERVAIRRTDERSDATGGAGVDVFDRARAVVVDSVLERNQGASVLVQDEDSFIRLEGTLVRDTRDAEEAGMGGSLGQGAQAELGARLELAGAWLVGHRDAAVFAQDPGTVVTAEDVVVRGTRSETTDGAGGNAFAVERGAHVTLARALLVDNREAAVSVRDEGSRLEATDLTVLDTSARPSDGRLGAAIATQDGPTLEVERARLARNQDTTLLLRGVEGRLADVVVEATREVDGAFGRGATVSMGSAVTLERVELAECREVALIVDGAELTLRDGLVRDTRSRSRDEAFGSGINVVRGGVLRGERIRLLDNRAIGIGVGRDGARFEASEVVVLGTQEQGCADAGCPEVPGGVGVVARNGGAIELTGFRIGDSALAGVYVEADVDLHDGEVFGSPVGAAVSSADYDTARLGDEVVYRDNDVNLDTRNLPVPMFGGL